MPQSSPRIKRVKVEESELSTSNTSNDSSQVEDEIDFTSLPGMEGVDFTAMHGNLMSSRQRVSKSRTRTTVFGSGVELRPPRLISASDAPAREGYDRTMIGHEYIDEPETLLEKVKMLAQLLRVSNACVAYTGAGISTGAGIGDYASRANADSITHNLTKKKAKIGYKEVLPGRSHRVLVALHRAGMLHEWVQQNHDGLPQKAGLPQHCINELHGAWFDPSNPVVTMSGTLREDLSKRFQQWKKKADLVLALGTSLAAVGADSIVDAAVRKQGNMKGNGAVIISLQRTYYDDVS
jgi:NAD-dependent SIR2 family protein deacetylase